MTHTPVILTFLRIQLHSPPPSPPPSPFNKGIIRLIFVNAYYKHLKIVHAQLKASSVHINTYKVEDSFCLNLRINNPQ